MKVAEWPKFIFYFFLQMG